MMARMHFGVTLALAGVLMLGSPLMVKAQDTETPAPATPAQAPITVNFKDAPIREALETLFRGTGINYAIAPDVVAAAPTVTLSLQDVPFETALRVLLNTAGLAYSRTDGVYQIKVKAAPVDTGVGLGTVTDPGTDLATVEPTVLPQIEKIPLNFVDAGDIYNLLHGQAPQRNYGGGGGGYGGGGGFGGGGFGGGGGSFGGGGFGGGGSFGGGGFGGGGGSFGGGGFGGGGSFGGGSFGGGSSGFGGGGFGGGGGSFGGGGFGGGGFGR